MGATVYLFMKDVRFLFLKKKKKRKERQKKPNTCLQKVVGWMEYSQFH